MIVIPIFLIGARLKEYYDASASVKETAKLSANYVIEDPSVYEKSIYLTDKDIVDINELKKVNPDVIGYIKIDDTPIDYPVLKNEDQDKYLYHDFYGEYSVYGSIFIDNACYDGGMNTVLYGHRMKTGEMFGCLKNYSDEDFRKSHEIIKYITDDSAYVYKVCAILETSGTNKDLKNNLVPYTKSECDEFIEYINQNGIVYDDISWGDSLITLTTCEYTHKKGRLMIIGKLIEETII